MKNKISLLLYPILLLIILLLTERSCSNKNKYLEATKTLEWLNDSVIYTKNKLGETSAKVSVLRTENANFLLSLKSEDKIIQRLQLLVSKYEKEIKKGGSITVVHDSTYIYDTIVGVASNDSIVYKVFEPNRWYAAIFKTYTTETENIGNLSVWFRNEYSIIIGEEKNGLFKKPTPFALVTNLNPYSITKEVKSFQTTVPKKNWNISAQVGGGLTPSGLQPYIGIGLGYSIFKF